MLEDFVQRTKLYEYCMFKRDIFQQEIASDDYFKPDKTFGSGFGVKDLFFDSPIVHPNYWQEKPNKKLVSTEDNKQELPKLGYHGKDKYKYAFHEPWKPLDRLGLLAQAEKDETGKSADLDVPKQITP
ncbi:unnamed protein product [Leptosia nina]|uniref:Uncharacterized protein n=1 Tax=Leptosia nina TaxID=320188 RepID=A0AAV1J014_9NEOP